MKSKRMYGENIEPFIQVMLLWEKGATHFTSVFTNFKTL